jgi:hypothetical protein
MACCTAFDMQVSQTHTDNLHISRKRWKKISLEMKIVSKKNIALEQQEDIVNNET